MTSPTRTATKCASPAPSPSRASPPHRVLAVDENDEFIETFGEGQAGYGSVYDFAAIILENLRTAGVQQAHKEDRIDFTSLTPWPGHHVCAEGRYFEGGEESGIQRRAAIFIGPEFGTVSRPDLVEAAREAADCDFDSLIACAFNYEAHTTEFEKLGKIPVLKARMNADLHMAADLKNTGKGNLFVIFGEPDIDLLDADDGQIRVRVKRASTSSIPTPAKYAATGRTGSPAGSSTPTTTATASSCATPTSSAPTTLTRPSRPRLRPRSTPTPGNRCAATPPARLIDPHRAASPSKSSIISAMR